MAFQFHRPQICLANYSQLAGPYKLIRAHEAPGGPDASFGRRQRARLRRKCPARQLASPLAGRFLIEPSGRCERRFRRAKSTSATLGARLIGAATLGGYFLDRPALDSF